MEYKIKEIDGKPVFCVYVTDINNPPSFKKEYICKINGVKLGGDGYHIYYKFTVPDYVTDELTIPADEIGEDEKRICDKIIEEQDNNYQKRAAEIMANVKIIRCENCGKKITYEYNPEEMHGQNGKCAHCGKYLCRDCAKWENTDCSDTVCEKCHEILYKHD